MPHEGEGEIAKQHYYYNALLCGGAVDFPPCGNADVSITYKNFPKRATEFGDPIHLLVFESLGTGVETPAQWQ